MLSFEDFLKADALAEAKKPKKFDKQAHVRALSRAAMGQPPSKKVIVSKKFKPPKHKNNQHDD